MGGDNNPQLHIFFFPFMGHGHMIPMVDMTKLFAMRGVKTTIATTPLNVPFFSNTIQRSKKLGINIDIRILKFPHVEAGLPEGCENVDFITKSQEANLGMMCNFFKATAMLQKPLEQLIHECKPDCLLADTFFSWAADSADKFEIPMLVFNGDSISVYEPYKKVESVSEPFVIPNLPADIKLTRNQMADVLIQQDENDFTKLLRSYGVIVNSFYELEAAYVDHYRNVLGRKAWHIGPVSLCKNAIEDKADRGNKASIDEHECLKWLDSKETDSVVYICFGSVANFNAVQLIEIAFAIEASNQQFIWVIRKEKNDDSEEENWLPEGFEKRMEGKGLVSAGVPMVTWPVYADQFYNEKLVTQVLKVGIGVGAQKWVEVVGDFVRRDAIEKAVKEIMVGERAEEMRSRAKALGEMAKRAVQQGGSSFSDLNALIEELNLRRR
ncbi:hypothetical protein DITRI_Ditri01bG0065800 [Diplodiscus trichospermus]